MEKKLESIKVATCPRCHKGVNGMWSYCPICGERLFVSTEEAKYVEDAIKFAKEHGYGLETHESALKETALSEGALPAVEIPKEV